MKLMDGLFAALSAGLVTTLRLQRRKPAPEREPIDYLHIFLTVLVWSAGLFLVSLFLPDDLAQLAQDFMAWCLAGTVAAIAVVATVKGLEGLLDT